MTRLFAMMALALTVVLGACQTAPDGSLDRQKTAANVQARYDVIKATAALYVALPRCGTDTATAVCSDPAVAAQIAKAVAVADVAVAQALREILLAPNQSEVTQWVSRALSAIAVLTQALATYGVK